MASYTINSLGSATMAVPSKAKKGDIWTFNATNINAATRYKGTILMVTIPNKCIVKMEAWGARGAKGNFYNTAESETARAGRGGYCAGTLTLEAGDQLLILVGQHGKDYSYSSSVRDGCAGGGGGATTIAIRKSNGKFTFKGTSDSGSGGYNGWTIEPLLIAAGGNGSRDIGYSGTGTIYDAKAFVVGTAEKLGSSSTPSTYLQGGTFSLQYGAQSSNQSSRAYGRSFLDGGLGSLYGYSRNSDSSGGFGGGAGNKDDAEGGGGGGWVSGYRTAAAMSYFNNALLTETTSTAGANYDDGKVVFTIIKDYLDPTIFVNNTPTTVVKSKESYVYVNDTLKYKKIKELYVHDGTMYRKVRSGVDF